MKKPLRILLVILAILAVPILGVLAWGLWFLDPNDLKPRITQYAARQNIVLEMGGDLSWQLLPRLGIRVHSTRIHSPDDSMPEVDFETLTLSAAWLPLLQGQLRLESLDLQGAEVRIRTTDQAAMAAAAPIAAAPQSTTSPAATDGHLVIAVRAVTVQDSRVILEGPAGGRTLEDLALEGRDILLDGSLFPVTLEFRYLDPALSMPVTVAAQTELSVDARQWVIAAPAARLQLTPEGRPPIEADFDIHFSSSDDTLEVKGLELRSEGLDAQAALQLSQLGSEPRAVGRIELASGDPRPLLQAWQVPLPGFSAADALARVALALEFDGSAQEFRLDNLRLQLDDSSLTGTIAARLPAPRELTASLRGDRLDLGRYRTSAGESSTSAPAGALLAPLAAPVAFLEGGTGQLDLDWDEFVLDQLEITGMRLRVRYAGDQLRIEDLSLQGLGGSATLRGQLEGLTGGQPRVSFEPRLEAIALEQVRQTLAPDLMLNGTLDLTMAGSARGSDSAQWQQSLDARGSFHIADPVLLGTNIERVFCDLAATVERTEKRTNWADRTQFVPIDGTFQLVGHRAILDEMTTGIGNLQLRASGTFDSRTQAYQVQAITRLDGDRTSADGCPIRSSRLRGRDIPLRCTGDLGGKATPSCAPDTKFVAGLLQERVLDELRERVGGENAPAKGVEGLLRGLLKQGGNGD